MYPSKLTIKTPDEDVEAITLSKNDDLICCTRGGLSFYETKSGKLLNKLDFSSFDGFFSNKINSIYSPESCNDVILSTDAGQLYRISQNGPLLSAKCSESAKHVQLGFWIDDETE